MIYKNDILTKQNIEILHDLFDEIYELDERISELENADYNIRDFLDPSWNEMLDTSEGYEALLTIHSDKIIDELPDPVWGQYPEDINWGKYYRHSMTAGMIVRINEIPSYIVQDYVNKFRNDIEKMNEKLDAFDTWTSDKRLTSQVRQSE